MVISDPQPLCTALSKSRCPFQFGLPSSTSNKTCTKQFRGRAWLLAMCISWASVQVQIHRKSLLTCHNFSAARSATGFRFVAAFPSTVREFVTVNDDLGSFLTKLQSSLNNLSTEESILTNLAHLNRTRSLQFGCAGKTTGGVDLSVLLVSWS